MPHLLYLLGEPGAGKSSVLAALLTRLGPGDDRTRPFAHTLYRGGGVAYLGAHGGLFPGTDRLSMAVVGAVEGWLAEARPAIVLGEGDRLANRRFLTAAARLGYTLSLAHLETPLAAERRRRRGTIQNPVWVAGRITKHRNLAAEFGARCVDSSGSAEATLRKLAGLPALKALGIA